MADLARIKRNVAKMAGMNAPEADIDAYIASEGVTVDDVRAFQPPAADAKKAMYERFEKVAAPLSPHNQPSLGDTLGAFQTGAHQGMTLGFGDEINAGLGAVPLALVDALTGKDFDVGRAYGEGLNTTKGYIDERTSKAPTAALLGELTGGVATGGALAKGGLTLMKPGMSVPGAVVRGGAEGAAYGGVSGFGNSDADNLMERGGDALEGAYMGAGTGGVLSGVGSRLSGAGTRAPVPTVDDLKASAGALYDKAEASGVTFSRPEVKTIADDITADVIAAGIDPTLHPRATAALKRLSDAGATGMTVKDAQTMRRVIAAAAKDPMNPDEQRIASIMIDRFDDMVAGKAPDLAEARKLYHTAKKGELIETAIELAQSRAGQYSQSGMENALRTEFRHLQREIIKGRLKGLSPAEIDAINKVANGGALDNLARYVGKLAPTGAVSFMAGGGIPFMIGNAVGGPAVGAAASGATMATGLGARAAAEALTSKNALGAALLARNGGVSATKMQMTPRQLAIARALVAGGAGDGGQLPFEMMGSASLAR